MDNVRVTAKDEEGNEIIVKTAKGIERGYQRLAQVLRLPIFLKVDIDC